MSSVLTALAAPRRLEILRLVWAHELPAGKIDAAMPEVSFGAVSQHLRALGEAGLVARRAAAASLSARREAWASCAGGSRRCGTTRRPPAGAGELEAARRGPRPRQTGTRRARPKRKVR